VGLETGYWLDGLAVQDFSLLHSDESGAHPASYRIGCFPGINWQGHEADHSPAYSAEVKKWSNTSTSPYVLMA
jgi:hypothetical protein